MFFLLAGFFAYTLFHRYGTQEFLRNQAMRIFLPLTLGRVVCIVCIAGVVLWYLTKLNGGQIPKSIPPSLANVGLNFLHHLLERLGSSWLMRVLIGLGAALLCLMIAEPQVSVATINDMQTKLTYAVLYAVAIVSLMFGFIGLGIRFFLNRHRLLEIYLILPTGCISHTFQSSWRYRFG